MAALPPAMDAHNSYKPMEPPSPRRKKRLACIIAAVIVVIGLGLGIGLGIGLRKGDDDDGDDDSGSAPPRTEKWEPAVGASWQIILKYPLDTAKSLTPGDVDVYDLDLFDNDRETFAALQERGIKVICYFSAGSYEDYRTDSKDFAEEDMGDELDGWPGERWLKLSSPNVREIMKKRIALAAKKGCDAIDPDNVDGYQNENGLDLTEEDSISMMKFLSEEAAQYKMAVGLKNAGSIIPKVLPLVDFSVNEQCAQYNECDTFAQFVDDGKPVFQIEYPDGGSKNLNRQQAKDRCAAEGMDGFSTVLKNMNLDGWVEYCDGKVYETATEG